MPDVVSDELFKGYLPMINKHFLRDILNASHEPFNILNKNVISRDEDLFLGNLL